MPESTTSNPTRLEQTNTFRGGGLGRWHQAAIALVGAGVIGSRLAPEIVRSGASVRVFDPDTVEPHNLATQAFGQAGVRKVDAVVANCDRIRPGRARGSAVDVRAANAELLGCDAIVDCSDDPDLGVHLSKLSNGLGLPGLRAAVAADGQIEYGRVAVSHGGRQHACHLCSATPADLAPRRRRTPCPGATSDAGQPPTLAGGAIALAICGIALLQLQRIVTGNDLDRALDREIMLNLSDGSMHDVGLQRSDACVSGHKVWGSVTPVDASAGAEDTSLAELFAIARDLLQAKTVALEPLGQPLSLGAECPNGHAVDLVGALRSPTPACVVCGAATRWRRDVTWPRLTAEQARALGILNQPLAELGLSSGRALLLARAVATAPVALWLRAATSC